MDDFGTNRRRDYTQQPKASHSLDGLVRPHVQSQHGYQSSSINTSAHTPPVKDDQYVNVSIRISVPDVSHWRIAKFIKEYPYFSSAIAIGGLIILLLLIVGLTTLWHAMHPHKPEVTMLLSNILNAG